jgi:hypothetical protein
MGFKFTDVLKSSDYLKSITHGFEKCRLSTNIEQFKQGEIPDKGLSFKTYVEKKDTFDPNT